MTPFHNPLKASETPDYTTANFPQNNFVKLPPQNTEISSLNSQKSCRIEVSQKKSIPAPVPESISDLLPERNLKILPKNPVTMPIVNPKSLFSKFNLDITHNPLKDNLSTVESSQRIQEHQSSAKYSARTLEILPKNHLTMPIVIQKTVTCKADVKSTGTRTCLRKNEITMLSVL